MSSINIESKLHIQKISRTIHYNFSRYLDDNLSNKLLSSISNLISLDYIHRLEEQIDIIQHSDICSNRVKKFLGYKVIMQEDFSTAMSLFIIAITPENTHEQIDINQQNKDLVIEAIISKFYINLSLDEINNIRVLLKNLFNNFDIKEIINYINQDPEIFKLTVESAIINNKTQNELGKIVQKQIQETVNEKSIIDKKINGLKETITKITVVSSILASVILGASLATSLLPLLIIPAAGLSLKIAPMIGEKLATNTSTNRKNLFNFKGGLTRIQTELTQEISQKLENSIVNEKIQPTIANQAKEIFNTVELDIDNISPPDQNAKNKIAEKKQDISGIILKK